MKQGTIFYSYDASGNKLSQSVEDENGQVVSKTDYAGAFEYRDSELSLLHHAEGRVSFAEGETGNYHFDLKDHLGNIRVTFSDKPTTQAAMASMELAAAPLEEALFSGVAESRQTLAFHNTTDASIQEPEPNQVATLLPGQEGPSKSVAVQAGDTVHLQVNARYETSPSQVQGLEGIASEIVGAVEKTAAGLETQGAGGSLNGIAASGALASGEEQSVPKAYLNYLLYDEEYQLLDQGYVQVSEAAAVGKNNPDAKAEELSLDVAVAEDGFLYTYLSYEGPGGSASSSPASSSLAANSSVPANGPIANNSIPVYFDDFTIEQQSYIVAVHDLYPFGADFDQSPSRSVGLNGKYSYQGKEWQSDLGLNLYEFHARQYDPLLGRWHVPDPARQYASPYLGMGNNPVMMIDPDGEFAFVAVALVIAKAAAIGAGVGAASYGISTAVTGQSWDWEQFGKSVGLGAAAGALTAGVGLGISSGLSSVGVNTATANFVGGFTANVATSFAMGGIPQDPAQIALLAGSSVLAGASYTNPLSSAARPNAESISPQELAALGVGEDVVPLPGITVQADKTYRLFSRWGDTNYFLHGRDATLSAIHQSTRFWEALYGPGPQSVTLASGGQVEVPSWTGGEAPSPGLGRVGSASKLSPRDLKSFKSNYRNMVEHMRKLRQYMKNPHAYDNLGHLSRNAGNPAIQQRIINSRISHLKKEINTFYNNMQKLLK